MADLPMFVRPLYWSSASNVATFDGVGSYGVDVQSYPCARSALQVLVSNASATVATLAIGFSSSKTGALRLYTTDSSTFTVTWLDTGFRDMCGFSGNLSGANSYDATHIPEYTWIPTHAAANQSMFSLDHRERFSGRISNAGTTAGVNASGSDIYYKDFIFQYELAANVSSNFTENAYLKKRTIDYFYTGSSTDLPDSSTAQPTTGFYWFRKYSDIASAGFDLTTNLGIDGVDVFGATNTHVFCSFTPGSLLTRQPSLPTTLERIGVEFSCNTATPPTWNNPL